MMLLVVSLTLLVAVYDDVCIHIIGIIRVRVIQDKYIAVVVVVNFIVVARIIG